MRKKKVFCIVFFFVALLGFAIYEEELAAQWNRQYVIESNVEEWNGVPVSIKGEADYNHLCIGMVSFEGTVTLNNIEIDYEHGSSYDRIELWYPDEREPNYSIHMSDHAIGRRIVKWLKEPFLHCEYDPQTEEIHLYNNENEYRLIPIAAY